MSNKETNAYLRLTSAAFQMGVVIFLGAYFGKKLDENSSFEKPIYTIILSLLGVAIGLYLIIKEVMQINKNDENK